MLLEISGEASHLTGSELGPQTKDELIDIIMTARELIEVSLVNKFMGSMSRRYCTALAEVIGRSGHVN
jgi:hypothetical protein